PVHPKSTLNGVPAMAFGVDDPPGMLSGAGWMVTVNVLESDVLLASLTVTVKVYLPTVVGVPVSTPLPRNVRPGGMAPEVIEKVIGEAPPILPTVPEYPAPTTPSGSDAKTEILTGAAPTTSVSCAVAVPFAASFTVKVG